MAEYNAPATLASGAYTVTFNDGTGDTGIHDPTTCTGLDQAPVRPTVEDAPQTDGGIWQPFKKGPRRIVLAGNAVIRSAGDEAGYLAAIATWEAALIQLLENTYTDDSASYTWTPSDGIERTIYIRCEVPAVFAGAAGLKRYSFGLVAIDPAIYTSP